MSKVILSVGCILLASCTVPGLGPRVSPPAPAPVALVTSAGDPAAPEVTVADRLVSKHFTSFDPAQLWTDDAARTKLFMTAPAWLFVFSSVDLTSSMARPMPFLESGAQARIREIEERAQGAAVAHELPKRDEPLLLIQYAPLGLGDTAVLLALTADGLVFEVDPAPLEPRPSGAVALPAHARPELVPWDRAVLLASTEDQRIIDERKTAHTDWRACEAEVWKVPNARLAQLDPRIDALNRIAAPTRQDVLELQRLHDDYGRTKQSAMEQTRARCKTAELDRADREAAKMLMTTRTARREAALMTVAARLRTLRFGG